MRCSVFQEDTLYTLNSEKPSFWEYYSIVFCWLLQINRHFSFSSLLLMTFWIKNGDGLARKVFIQRFYHYESQEFYAVFVCESDFFVFFFYLFLFFIHVCHLIFFISPVLHQPPRISITIGNFHLGWDEDTSTSILSSRENWVPINFELQYSKNLTS